MHWASTCETRDAFRMYVIGNRNEWMAYSWMANDGLVVLEKGYLVAIVVLVVHSLRRLLVTEVVCALVLPRR